MTASLGSLYGSEYAPRGPLSAAVLADCRRAVDEHVESMMWAPQCRCGWSYWRACPQRVAALKALILAGLLVPDGQDLRRRWR